MNAAGPLGTTLDSLHFVLVNIPSESVGTSGSKATPAMDNGSSRLPDGSTSLRPPTRRRVRGERTDGEGADD